MYTVGNIYVITAVAVIGGGLFGFDIAPMSAIISTEPYLCYFKVINRNSDLLVEPGTLTLYLVKSKETMSTSATSNWAFNFALAYFVPPEFANITWKVYILSVFFCTAMFIHVFFMFPGTASKTLEEVDNIFDDSTPGALRLIGTPAWKTHVNKDIHHTESGNVDPEKLATLNAYHAEDKTAGLPDEAPKV
ncbi:hypothetical protein VC83_03176 [Pseudogymnoascus destructans]|uniref:Major facilitator superfamily (MFS) profile domain-containing protein n=1 Tax=Pseudogymnoascus destructans TaxID=655981 RepID=A0A177AGC9_9PEZI|nr:uncharacterized protein VC83_03176 [Pseudogymnoascus destructans]OAF60233.1 hypothetical protein VC83_03176 [Pseudogymnoascus destructans]